MLQGFTAKYYQLKLRCYLLPDHRTERNIGLALFVLFVVENQRSAVEAELENEARNSVEDERRCQTDQHLQKAYLIDVLAFISVPIKQSKNITRDRLARSPGFCF